MNFATTISVVEGYNLTHEDELAVSPRYYGYTRQGGAFVIMRKLDTGDGTFIYEFHCGNNMTDYDTDWTGRLGITYVRAGDLKENR